MLTVDISQLHLILKVKRCKQMADDKLEPIKLKVISDGTASGTKLVEIGTGREVHGVQELKLHGHYNRGKPFILSVECMFVVYGDDGQASCKMPPIVSLHMDS
ncbi:MAG: hypothetical protein GY938_13120 [Ketobacter sp.]|nr:hypothetical protein [Ketobacter sp.]